MDQETTYAQKQIIQHIHKLLEKPEDWQLIKYVDGEEAYQYSHVSGIHVSCGFDHLYVGFPGAQQLTVIINRPLVEAFEVSLNPPKVEDTSDSQLLAFLKSIKQ